MAAALSGCPDDGTPVTTLGDTSSSEGGEESNTNATVTQTTTMDTTADTSGDSSSDSTDTLTTTRTTTDTDESSSTDVTDSSSSSDGGPMCGDDVADRGEDCDGTDLAGATCVTQGFGGGTLACAGDCTFDTSGCTNDCGNGTIDAGEDCDGAALGGEDCVSQGFDGGTLSCALDCTFDTDACTMETCGNNSIEAPEVCDGTDLAGEDCTSQGFGGGTLACAGNCMAFDTSGCASDDCCTAQGAGVTGCSDDACTAAVCGIDGFCCMDHWDGVCVGEAFDLCQDVCTPVCGDGIASAGVEQCDGGDLAGQSCASLGFDNGTLACDAACNVDTTGCVDVPDEWTCSVGFYGTNDGCDCGCGALDPDCADNTAASCGFCNDTGACDTTGAGCPGIIDPVDNTSCVAPPEWTCSVNFFDADDGCDCGCGAFDPDCADNTAASCGFCNDTGSCDDTGAGCPGLIDADDNSACEVPAGWTCNPTFFNTDDGCDCGCGVVDPDCADETGASCQFCNDTGSCDDTGAGCPGIIDVADNAHCSGAPNAWTCSDSFYNADDGCDCGCGAFDPDCADATSASCGFCNDTGSCDNTGGGCPGIIDDDDNSVCDAGNSDDLVAGPGLALAVTDGGYDGTLASMACVTLPLVADGVDTVSGVQLVIGYNHTWIGDGTIKVVSPAGTVVTVLSRPGVAEASDNGVDPPYGDSSNTVATSPITFVDGGPTDAETMGSTTPAPDNVCENDALCVYDPNPGAALAGDFSSFNGQSAVGNWQVCVGDSATPDQPVIDAVTLTIDQI